MPRLQQALAQALPQWRGAGLALDDLHFADEASLELLPALVAALREQSVPCLLALRDAETPPRRPTTERCSPWWSATHQQRDQQRGHADGRCGAGGASTIAGGTASISVAEGAAATFSVAVNGSDPLSYQWRRNGAVFAVRVSNAAGEVLSGDATLTVTPTLVAASIAGQPDNRTVNAGQSATFGVTATGSAPLAYQWRRNGSDIAGATAASYATPATIDADDGARFSVLVSNAAPNAAVSSEAVLTVTPAIITPAITMQPPNASVNVGASATFSVQATGSAPLAYQWRRNGSPIAGATVLAVATLCATTPLAAQEVWVGRTRDRR